MNAWIDAFLPTFAMVVLGFVLRRVLLREEAAWTGLEILTYWVLLPSLFAHSISTVRLQDVAVGGLAIAIWSTLAIGTALALLLARALGQTPAATTSTVQGGIRFNNYMALAIASGLYGPEGLGVAGIVAGLFVPVAQTIVTLVFVACGGRKASPLGLLRHVFGNPLLLGCLLGFVGAAFGGFPAGIEPLVNALGQASLALGLLSVGAALSLGALREAPWTQAAVSAQKLALMPAIAWCLCRALGLEGLPVAIAVLTAAMPTAANAYVLARLMGGDARLMAAIVTVQHLLAAVTLPLWAALLRAG